MSEAHQIVNGLCDGCGRWSTGLVPAGNDGWLCVRCVADLTAPSPSPVVEVSEAMLTAALVAFNGEHVLGVSRKDAMRSALIAALRAR